MVVSEQIFPKLECERFHASFLAFRFIIRHSFCFVVFEQLFGARALADPILSYRITQDFYRRRIKLCAITHDFAEIRENSRTESEMG